MGTWEKFFVNEQGNSQAGYLGAVVAVALVAVPAIQGFGKTGEELAVGKAGGDAVAMGSANFAGTESGSSEGPWGSGPPPEGNIELGGAAEAAEGGEQEVLCRNDDVCKTRSEWNEFLENCGGRRACAEPPGLELHTEVSDDAQEGSGGGIGGFFKDAVGTVTSAGGSVIGAGLDVVAGSVVNELGAAAVAVNNYSFSDALSDMGSMARGVTGTVGAGFNYALGGAAWGVLSVVATGITAVQGLFDGLQVDKGLGLLGIGRGEWNTWGSERNSRWSLLRNGVINHDRSIVSSFFDGGEKLWNWANGRGHETAEEKAYRLYLSRDAKAQALLEEWGYIERPDDGAYEGYPGAVTERIEQDGPVARAMHAQMIAHHAIHLYTTDDAEVSWTPQSGHPLSQVDGVFDASDVTSVEGNLHLSTSDESGLDINATYELTANGLEITVEKVYRSEHEDGSITTRFEDYVIRNVEPGANIEAVIREELWLSYDAYDADWNETVTLENGDVIETHYGARREHTNDTAVTEPGSARLGRINLETETSFVGTITTNAGESEFYGDSTADDAETFNVHVDPIARMAEAHASAETLESDRLSGPR